MSQNIDPEILTLAREEASDSLERIEGNLLAIESGSAEPDAIDSMFRDAHSIKGTAGMVGWSEASSIAHVMEDRLESCRTAGAFPPRLVEPLLRATDVLRRAVGGDVAGVAGAIAELGVAEPSSAPPPGGADTPGPAEAREPATAAGAPAGPVIRVAAEKVDRMLDAVGETALHQRRLAHELGLRELAQDDAANEELELGERLLSELQSSVLQMRTLPLSTVTSAYPRAIRDIAVAEGKEVELIISGADTQLDRVILDGISETITHLLRNSVAHGIEVPEERVRAGKPARGRVELHAEQRGAMVAIEISDDGRGVASALQASAGPSESLADVLSRPGFSTATEVSDLAGRGIGLDAVKSRVERVGGSVEVSSEPSHGTVVTLLLPLTLALLRVLMCERDGHVFGVPLVSVREVTAVTDVVRLGGRPRLKLHDDSVPLSDLAALLGIAAAPLPEFVPAIVLEISSHVGAISCDRVMGDQEIVMKGLGPVLNHVPGYLGASILGDGRIALILDPHHLLKAKAPATPTVAVAATPTARAAHVLVVDDQFTVRELQRSILETAGYVVETARDGREALARIASGADVDLILTDVQMPEMDGFELLRSVRRQPEHAALPVVMVTSLGSDEDRARGAEEGADAYMVKDEFDQRSLLDTLERLIGR
jgi:two-component system chemotaxis sensor kinase CheA